MIGGKPAKIAATGIALGRKRSRAPSSLQLLRASQSIPLNIAEGNGKGTPPDRRRFFEIARGSALECAAIQDYLTSCQAMTAAQNIEGKTLLLRIVSMLTKLGQRRHEVREHSEGYGGLDCVDNDNDNDEY